MIEKGKKYLITTNDWFYTPEGESCKAVWGTCEIIRTEDAFGFTPARPSTNWFLKVGNMIVAGCQIHYAIQCEKAPENKFKEVRYQDKDTGVSYSASRIYIADAPEAL